MTPPPDAKAETPGQIGYSIYAEICGWSAKHGLEYPYSCTRIRGPYKHAETAGVVRSLLEELLPEKEWNLKIIEEEFRGN